MKLVINKCYGGFGLSEAAYKWLIANGVPVRKYIEQKRGKDGLYLKEPLNDGEVIFDRSLEPVNNINEAMNRLSGRYWDSWTRDDDNRTHPLIVAVVEALGAAANGPHAKLEVIEIPDDVRFEIDDYDGIETVHELHRSW